VRWSVSKALLRTGAAALVLFIAKSWFDLANNEAGVAWSGILSSNAIVFVFLWLGVAEIVYVAVRRVPAFR